MIELFRRYPRLRTGLAYLPLGNWPTPVRALSRLSDGFDLYIKDDGLSGPLYGGNKVRKLEFLLADALARDARKVLTFGVAGSNHALATALYAEAAGLRCISVLTPQRNARYVAHNLLSALSTNAELHHFATDALASEGTRTLIRQHSIDDGIAPVVIPGGGSSALGTVGFVNAAFELAAQIDAGLLPAPDRLYVALGTMGTAAGLLLGLRACKLTTRLIPIRVVREDIGNLNGMQKLYEQTNALLHRIDPDFPLIPFDHQELRHDQFGERYAVFTAEGMAARHLLAREEHLSLEGTYTAKTMAALLADRDAGALNGLRVLYWHTYNAQDLSERIARRDYHDLPAGFHSYFQRPVQTLDVDDYDR